MPSRPSSDPFALYIHIPFCKHKCPYCDFNTYAVNKIPEQEYLSALLAELDYQAVQNHWAGRQLLSVYFGGGTPSLLSAETISELMRHIRIRFDILSGAEIGLEANPGTLTVDKLQAYLAAGLNRLSLGAQSSKDAELKILGRDHSFEQTRDAILLARELGLENVSLDLLYGLPGQNLSDLDHSVQAYLSLEPEHISAYCLTYEKGTPLYQAMKKGSVAVLDESTLCDMMEYLEEKLPQQGFCQYEISNFSKPGCESSHNMAYWKGADYLGLGAGAHSFFRENNKEGVRWSNRALPVEYIEATCSTGKAEAWKDSLVGNDLIFEFFFLGLRMNEGLSEDEFEARFGCKLDEWNATLFTELEMDGFLKKESNRIFLTAKGRLLSDSVFEQICDGASNAK